MASPTRPSLTILRAVRAAFPGRRRTATRVVTALLLCCVAVPGCASSPEHASPTAKPAAPHHSGRARSAAGKAARARLLPGMPPLLDPNDVYAADRPDRLSPAVKGFPSRVYVPNTKSDTVSVIDPRTYKVIRTIRVGHQPQHVVPSWDLKTLWVNNDLGNSLTPIDPATGQARQAGATVARPVQPLLHARRQVRRRDGLDATGELVFRDPHTMEVGKAVPVDCAGVNHADFSAGRPLLHRLLRVLRRAAQGRHRAETVVGAAAAAAPTARCRRTSRSRPDGRTFYVADMMANGVWVLDGDTLRRVRRSCPPARAPTACTSAATPTRCTSPTAARAPSPCFDFADRTSSSRSGSMPGGGSPDMGGVSADGKVLWLSGPLQRARCTRSTPRTGRPARPDPGRRRAARPARLSAAGPLLARPHRHLPLSDGGINRPENRGRNNLGRYRLSI